MDLTYIDQIAQRIRALIPSSKLPGDDDRELFRIYAVLVLAKGSNVSASDVHNAWVAWMCERNPRHASLVPFDRLPEEVAADDIPYVRAIHLVAEEITDGDIRF